MAGGALQAALIRGRFAPVRIHAGENSRQCYGYRVRDVCHRALRGGVEGQGERRCVDQGKRHDPGRAEEGTVRVN